MSLLSKFVENTAVGYVPYVFVAVMTTIVVSLSAWALHGWSMARAEVRHAQDLSDLRTVMTAQCEKDKQITNEVSNAYQTQLTDLRQQLATVKRVQPNRCVPTIAGSASGRDATAPNTQLPQPDGVYSDTLYDFAADAEQVGRQLDACQNFIHQVWEERATK